MFFYASPKLDVSHFQKQILPWWPPFDSRDMPPSLTAFNFVFLSWVRIACVVLWLAQKGEKNSLPHWQKLMSISIYKFAKLFWEGKKRCFREAISKSFREMLWFRYAGRCSESGYTHASGHAELISRLSQIRKFIPFLQYLLHFFLNPIFVWWTWIRQCRVTCSYRRKFRNWKRTFLSRGFDVLNLAKVKGCVVIKCSLVTVRPKQMISHVRKLERR